MAACAGSPRWLVPNDAETSAVTSRANQKRLRWPQADEQQSSDHITLLAKAKMRSEVSALTKNTSHLGLMYVVLLLAFGMGRDG